MSEKVLKIDTADFAKQMQRFEQETGKEGWLLFREMMRVLVETCYDWTAPPTSGKGAGGRTAGKAAVAHDVYTTIRAVDSEYIEWLLDLNNESSYIASMMIYSTGQTLTNIHIFESGDVSELRAHHWARRGNKGRTGRRRGEDNHNTNKAFAPAQAVARFIAEEQKRVGRMKSGWTPALRQLGSKKPPSWVVSAGSFSGKYGPVSGNIVFTGKVKEELTGTVTANNTAPYFRDGGMLDRAHAQSEQRMQKFGDQWIQRMIDKYNKQQGGG